jgi:predicted glycogen debranching enzyme
MPQTTPARPHHHGAQPRELRQVRRPGDQLVRSTTWAEDEIGRTEPLLSREWLVTNGLGGYASGTVSGVPTRRYHGLLAAALPSPLGRVLMLSHLTEQVRLQDGSNVRFGGQESAGGELEIYGVGHFDQFRLEAGVPVWTYRIDGALLEKRLVLSHRQNTAYLRYRLLEGDRLRLKLRPAVNFRDHDGPVSEHLALPYTLTSIDDRFEVRAARSDLPPLRLRLHGNEGAFTIERTQRTFLYRMEQARGYDSVGDLWSPGYFRVDLTHDRPAMLVASTETWEHIDLLPAHEAYAVETERRERLLVEAHASAHDGMAAELVLAADQFLITPTGRVEDMARARAGGDEIRSVIAGYHWFTDWGRDTMISLEGLTLCTGRTTEAGYILRTFAHYVKDGLIPNYFPDGQNQGVYHTADATLWFFHAIARYLDASGDQLTLCHLLPRLKEIIHHHETGTRFNIHVDHKDGLLWQGAEGYQLTWMDAKVGDWVVTPRRGKAVEINALWYNALRLMEGWVRELDGDEEADWYAGRAEKARRSFNQRFWYEKGGYLYDVLDGPGGDDAACRPNQVFAISLDHEVLDRPRWGPVMGVVREKLLTPVGLRSLSPDSPDFKPRYDGDLRARDAAYHQGTVWAWLIGPYIDAYLKLHPDDRAGARKLLDGFVQHLGEACIGSISEVFDAEPPFTPRGCIAQGWSVAEVLRSWVKTAE